MIRNLKLIVLTTGALLLLGGLTASSASATSIWFEGEEGIQTLTAEQEPDTWDIFTITGGTGGEKAWTCRHAHYTNETATVDTTESEIELTPTYGECSLGGISATLKLNGCDYRFYNPTTNASGQRTASTQITCPAGKVIETESSLFGTRKCLITFPPQIPAGHVIFTNTGIGFDRDVTATVTLNGIQYTEHAGTGFGACANGGGEDGTHHGSMIIRGRTHSGVGKGVWIDA